MGSTSTPHEVKAERFSDAAPSETVPWPDQPGTKEYKLNYRVTVTRRTVR